MARMRLMGMPASGPNPEPGPALFLEAARAAKPIISPLSEALAAVGQTQLLRQRLGYAMRSSLKCDLAHKQ